MVLSSSEFWNLFGRGKLTLPQCKKHQAATKKLEIYQVPDILVICIKRFGGSVRRSSDKLDNLVNFPVDGLDLSDRIGGRKVSKSLELSPEEAAKYGVHGDDEPLLYDLCRSRLLIDDKTLMKLRCRRQSLWRHGRWTLHSILPQQGGRQMVQL